MTIRRGQDWGRNAALPDGGVVLDSDAAAAALVTRCRRQGEPLPPVGLVGGDLCRTLGGRRDADLLRSDTATCVEVDVGRVTLDDGTTAWFVAHCLVGRWWWGPGAAVMNAAWYGPYRLGPRAHPGDALLDLTEGTLPLGDRWEARRRARTGAHVPHPALRTARRAEHHLEFGAPLRVTLDGQSVGRARSLEVAVEADALTVVV
ncbi:MAG: hypothetical protein JJU45_04145 [Acidimicrobiia bacterium]|nr:hypothetical protein [Acidimicrobiia bacterium]